VQAVSWEEPGGVGGGLPVFLANTIRQSMAFWMFRWNLSSLWVQECQKVIEALGSNYSAHQFRLSPHSRGSDSR
jgi:hypothetical protein